MKKVLAIASFVPPLVALCTLAGAPAARAQTPPVPTSSLPAETVRPQTATTGKTELVPTSLATRPKEDEEEQYTTDLSLSTGGLFSSGNARTVALTSAARLRLRRYEHQFTAAAAANFARAAQKDQRAETTVENYQGLARYDLFVGQRISLFAQTTARRDRFQGLDLRFNFDPGVAYHFIDAKNQRLIVELGYDAQYDLRRDDALVATIAPTTPDGVPVVVVFPKTRLLHNTRGFIGYENKLYPEVSFIASLEHIQNFEDFETYRLVFDVGLKSTIHGKLAVATTYTMRYENQPLPGVVKADSLASVALVYTLF